VGSAARSSAGPGRIERLLGSQSSADAEHRASDSLSDGTARWPIEEPWHLGFGRVPRRSLRVDHAGQGRFAVHLIPSCRVSVVRSVVGSGP
jgi:hypothetical protein